MKATAKNRANFSPDANQFVVNMGGTDFPGNMTESARFVHEFFDVDMDEILSHLRQNGNYTVMKDGAIATIERVVDRDVVLTKDGSRVDLGAVKPDFKTAEAA